jgi:septum formation protein
MTEPPEPPAVPPTRLVLASASPARLKTLRAAGVEPEVVVSGVDEEAVTADSPAHLAGVLAALKAEAVAVRRPDRVVVGCDSVLELDGEAYGKPADAAEAVERWRRMRGRTGVLHTGHTVITGDRRADAVASTTVRFAEIDDATISAYVDTGEPLRVAGAFTVDGLGGPFVEGIEGDHHNVVGISLPLLRHLLERVGVRWTDLWSVGAPS